MCQVEARAGNRAQGEGVTTLEAEGWRKRGRAGWETSARLDKPAPNRIHNWPAKLPFHVWLWWPCCDYLMGNYFYYS